MGQIGNAHGLVAPPLATASGRANWEGLGKSSNGISRLCRMVVAESAMESHRSAPYTLNLGGEAREKLLAHLARETEPAPPPAPTYACAANAPILLSNLCQRSRIALACVIPSLCN
jgi:hypothetical protein